MCCRLKRIDLLRPMPELCACTACSYMHLRVVGEVSSLLELLVEQRADVGVEAVGEREALVVPRVVLRAERRQRRRLAALGEVLVREVGVAHEAQDVGVGRQLTRRRRHCNNTSTQPRERSYGIIATLFIRRGRTSRPLTRVDTATGSSSCT